MMYLFSIYTFKGIKVFLYPNSILSFRKFLGIVAARLKREYERSHYSLMVNLEKFSLIIFFLNSFCIFKLKRDFYEILLRFYGDTYEI